MPHIQQSQAPDQPTGHLELQPPVRSSHSFQQCSLLTRRPDDGGKAGPTSKLPKSLGDDFGLL